MAIYLENWVKGGGRVKVLRYQYRVSKFKRGGEVLRLFNLPLHTLVQNQQDGERGGQVNPPPTRCSAHLVLKISSHTLKNNNILEFNILQKTYLNPTC